ncbi:unnamed protein product [Lota lota]
MRLRSRRNQANDSPTTRKNDERSSRARRRSRLNQTATKLTPRKITVCSNRTPASDDEVPMATRRPRGRKRPIAAQGRGGCFRLFPTETPPSCCKVPRHLTGVFFFLSFFRWDRPDHGFTTPVRPLTQRCLSLMKPDRTAPRNSTSRSVYSPLARFLTPSKESDSGPGEDRDILMSPEPFVFGYGSMGLLAGEEDAEDVFSPFTFIKNIPARSEQYKPSPRDIPPKMRSTPNGTLVLDLDETLLFSSLNVIENADCTFNTTFQDHQYKVYVILRPFVKDFLQAMAKVYEMFVYTSAKKAYAEKLLDILDPQRKLFRHRLYQEHCTCVLGHYIKDLNVLERDLSKTVILDNAPHTYPYHLMNTVPIKSWSGEQEDRELQRLIQYMEKLSSADDFRDILKRRKDHIHRLLSED